MESSSFEQIIFKLIKKTVLILLLLICVICESIVSDALMSESKELMSGKILRVVVLHYPPVMIIEKAPNGTIINTRGTAFEFLGYIGRALNIKYEFVLLTLENLKKYGMTPAQINMLISGEVDLAPLGLMPNPEKYQQVDLSVPISIDPCRLVVPYPKEESRLMAPLRPFQSTVWLCLGITLIVLAVSLTCLTIFYRKHIDQRRDKINKKLFVGDTNRYIDQLFRNFAFLLSHLTNQGYRYHLRLMSRGSWLLVGIWCLIAVVLANAYAGTLLSFLSVAKLEPVVKSLQELANAKQLKLLVIDRSELAIRFLQATDGTDKLIGDSLRANPNSLFSNLLDAKAKLLTREYALAHLDVFNYALIDATYRESNNQCRLTIAKEPLPMFLPASVGLSKSGPYTKAINEQIQTQREIGLFSHYGKAIMPRIDQCKMENKRSSSKHKKLSLIDISSAFVILGLGISLAVLVFLVELITNGINLHRSVISDFTKKDTNRLSIPPTTIPTNNKLTRKGKIEIVSIKDVGNVSIKEASAKSAEVIATVAVHQSINGGKA